MSKIVVLGASGTVGAELARLLKDQGQDVLRATSRAKPEADQIHVNLVSQAGVEQVAQADKIFLMSPPGHVNQDHLLIPVIQEAVRAKVKKIVLMTAMGADANPQGPMRKAELFLEGSGVAYNIIRPNWFMQNFNSYWVNDINQLGKILLPVEDAQGSFIDARDIAAVAARLLMTDEFNNKAFEITGDQALNHHEVAEILSKETKRVITYESISPEDMLKKLLQAGLPRPYAEFMLLILDFFRQGYSSRVVGTVQEITGKSPRRFDAYARDYRKSWLV